MILYIATSLSTLLPEELHENAKNIFLDQHLQTNDIFLMRFFEEKKKHFRMELVHWSSHGIVSYKHVLVHSSQTLNSLMHRLVLCTTLLWPKNNSTIADFLLNNSESTQYRPFPTTDFQNGLVIFKNLVQEFLKYMTKALYKIANI